MPFIYTICRRKFRLARINTLPIHNVLETVFYSAAEYEPIRLDSQSYSHNLAKALCQQLDFPRLINRVYEHGTRIFIEAKLLTHRVPLDLSPLYSQSQESVVDKIFYSQETSQFYKSITMKQENQQHVPPPSTANHKLVYKPRLPNLRNLQYQKLIENTTHLTKTHAAFLEARQESLRQISEITQLQIALLQQVLDQESLVDIGLKHLPIP